MTKPIHVMLDLESWGTRPGCEIRSIGACVFNPTEGWVAGMEVGGGDQPHPHTFYIATENPRGYYDARGRAVPHWYNDPRGWETKYDLHRDPDTEAWWADQSDEAQGAFADAVDLKVGLERFRNWLYQVSGEYNSNPRGDTIPTLPPSDIRLWSHGAAADAPWLAAAYHACGLPVPWHYRAPRDTRTLFDLAGIDDHSAWLKQHPGPLGIAHHSLDDAICQARAVCAAARLIRRWRNTSFSDDALPSDLNNIVAGIEDEGDRSYFGSTNDADHLREIAADMDAGRFEREL